MPSNSSFHVLMQKPATSAVSLPTWRSWAIWGCAALFYLYEMILRVSPGVMSAHLMRDFAVTSTTLGVLASFYHHAYVALQIPCGMIVDRFGARKVVTLSALFCTIGSYLFAYADSLFLAKIGRFLMGAGSACAFISTLKVGADWFLPSQFAMISALTNMMGTFGGTFGGRPFAMGVNAFGWRVSMAFMGLLGIVVTAICWLFIRNHPKDVYKEIMPSSKKEEEKQLPLYEGLKILVRKPQTWLMALVGGFIYLPVSSFTELWCVPYLMENYHISNEAAGAANTMLFIGVAVGSPLMVWISNVLRSRLLVMKWCIIATIVTFIIILTLPVSLSVMHMLLFLAGLFTGGQILSFVCIKESNPNNISGVAMGVANALVMMSSVIFQPAMGALLDVVWDGQMSVEGIPHYSIQAYKLAITAVPVTAFLGWLVLLAIKETHPLRSEKV